MIDEGGEEKLNGPEPKNNLMGTTASPGDNFNHIFHVPRRTACERFNQAQCPCWHAELIERDDLVVPDSPRRYDNQRCAAVEIVHQRKQIARKRGMSTIHIETTVATDGELHLIDLPCRRGDTVQAVLQIVPARPSAERDAALAQLLALARSSTFRSNTRYPSRDELHERR
jgi:hypothetical protein